MAKKSLDQVVSTSTKSKTFNFQKGNVRLEFSLRVDIKSELKDFSALLEVAKKEVDEELLKQ